MYSDQRRITRLSAKPRAAVVCLKEMGLQNIKYIVPAVQNPRAKVNTTVFQRTAPKLSYAKASQRWWIHIECDSDIDLYIFEKALSGSEIRFIELEERFYVEDPRIPDQAEIGRAHDLAETCIAQLNGATRILCPHFNRVRIESIVELLPNGTGRGIVSYSVHVHGTSAFPAIEAFLTGTSAPITSILPSLKANKDVQEALYYLGAEGNMWSNLYKASEVVEEDVGGGKAVVEKRLCSRSDWERFRRTANHQEAIGRFSRHARSQADPPPDPMGDIEARLFLDALVKRWIDYLTAPNTAAAPDPSM